MGVGVGWWVLLGRAARTDLVVFFFYEWKPFPSRRRHRDANRTRGVGHVKQHQSERCPLLHLRALWSALLGARARVAGFKLFIADVMVAVVMKAP